MQFVILAFFMVGSPVEAATPQEPDILIWEKDTINLYTYPLEGFLKDRAAIKERLNNRDCLSTACWRNYLGTWQIINDKLCLKELRDPCTRETIRLTNIFEEEMFVNDVVVATWFTGCIKADFGKPLGFSQEKFRMVYEKRISISISEGHVSSVEVVQSEESD